MSFALVAEDLTERLLRAAPVAVAVGGVDQVDAELERAVHDAARRVEIDAAAEIIAAEPDHGYVESGVTEPALLHP